MSEQLSYDFHGINVKGVNADGEEYCERVCKFTNREMADKYGKLFEAAPELLDALKEIHQLWGCPHPKRLSDWQARCDVMADYARKAMRMVEGTCSPTGA